MSVRIACVLRDESEVHKTGCFPLRSISKRYIHKELLPLYFIAPRYATGYFMDWQHWSNVEYPDVL